MFRHSILDTSSHASWMPARPAVAAVLHPRAFAVRRGQYQFGWPPSDRTGVSHHTTFSEAPMFQLSLSSIRRQLTVLLSVAALFLVLVAGVGAWALMRSASVARQSNDVNMPLQRVGNELIQAVGARAVAARNLVLATDPAVREHELGKVK
eukprot:Opistho-1_new@95330